MGPEQDERKFDRDKDIFKDIQKSKKRAQNCRAILGTACFICILLLAAIVVLHKATEVKKMLQSSPSCQTEKDQLPNNSQSEKNQELKKRVNDPTLETSQLPKYCESFKQKIQELEEKVNKLTSEKSQLNSNFESLNQKNQRLVKRVNHLSSDKRQLLGSLDSSPTPDSSSQKREKRQLPKYLDSPQQKNREKRSNLLSKINQLQKKVNSLNQKNQELVKRVNDLTSKKNHLQNNFNSLNQKNQELVKRVNDLTSKKNHLQNNFDSLSRKNQELEKSFNDLSSTKFQLQINFNSVNQKNQELVKRVNQLSSEKRHLQGTCDSFNKKNLELETELKKLFETDLFLSGKKTSWSESRQYCRDRDADLVKINSQVKQMFISSFVKEIVWIGLSDIENEREMKWVDNSSLNKTFWAGGEPNNNGGDEDCIELIPSYAVLKNWNDVHCAERNRGICEKIHSSH